MYPSTALQDAPARDTDHRTDETAGYGGGAVLLGAAVIGGTIVGGAVGGATVAGGILVGAALSAATAPSPPNTDPKPK